MPSAKSSGKPTIKHQDDVPPVAEIAQLKLLTSDTVCFKIGSH
jgi:hypothetical protein